MGACASGDAPKLTPEQRKEQEKEQQRTKAFDKQITTHETDDKQVNKLLLLGAGESGKSTLFKQTIKLYGSGFSEKERKQYLPAIQGNTVYAIKVLAGAASTIAKNGGRALSAASEEAIKSLAEMKVEDNTEVHLTPALVTTVKTLWADPAVNSLWENHSQLQLSDSAKFFLDRMDIISQPNYLPDDRDILSVRIRTTGIVQYRFQLKGHNFHLFDVGGQRTERRRWAHLFQEVTAVIFVAAISEYDQVLMEDEDVNRIAESLSLFEEIVRSQWFVHSSIMLFLNKSDLFKEKIVQKPLSSVYEDYKGANTYDAQVQFMTKLFVSKNTERRRLYPHITCAIDPNNVKFVLDVVISSIIKKNLDHAGIDIA